MLFWFVPFYRHDEAQCFRSANAFADLPATREQRRTLTNTGFRAEGGYARGHHNVKVGGTYWHTLLDEQFTVGLTDPLYNAVCVNGVGDPLVPPGARPPVASGAAAYSPNPAFFPRLLSST